MLGIFAVFLTVDSSKVFFFIHSITLTMFIDWDAVVKVGDDVAVPV